MKIIKLSLILLGMSASAALAQEERVEDLRQEAEELNEQRVAIEVQMREAEIQLAEAARRIAELSERNMPILAPDVEMIFDQKNKPRLGVTISSGKDDGPVDGVKLTGITPGSAAADAGLRAGDVVTAIGAEALSATTSRSANQKLVDFMSDVELGDKLEIEYLRDGNVGTLTLTPRASESRTFVFRDGNGAETFDVFGGQGSSVFVGPKGERSFQLGRNMFWASSYWSDMELVELSEGLGKYFGAKTGLLVVSVPDKNEFKLQDGDVITAVDDREPDSVGHMLRILASYEPGESLELRIMRDKKRQTIKLTMPTERIGSLFPVAPIAPIAPVAPPPAQAAGAPLPPVPDARALSKTRT